MFLLMLRKLDIDFEVGLDDDGTLQ